MTIVRKIPKNGRSCNQDDFVKLVDLSSKNSEYPSMSCIEGRDVLIHTIYNLPKNEHAKKI